VAGQIIVSFNNASVAGSINADSEEVSDYVLLRAFSKLSEKPGLFYSQWNKGHPANLNFDLSRESHNSFMNILSDGF